VWSATGYGSVLSVTETSTTTELQPRKRLIKSYTTLRNQFGTLTANTTTENLALGDQLINDSLRYLTTRFFFNEKTATTVTVANTQDYALPYNIKTLVNVFITIGNIRYQLREAPTRQFWDSLNFVPYTSDIPQFYYIFNKRLYVFPTPSSSSNTITYVYKSRLRDLSMADYTTGSVSATSGSTSITGSGTTFISDMADRWIRLTASASADPTGDEQWYQIASVSSTTALTLYNSYGGNTVTGANYVIGEMPLLPEDYQDLPVYRACEVYYTTRVPDATRAELFKGLFDRGYQDLEAEFGSKSWSVAITPNSTEVINPNLFVRNLS